MLKKLVATALTGLLLSAAPLPALAGQQWTQLNPPIPISIGTVPPPTYVALSPGFQQDKTVYMATGGALYESKDGGNSWTEPSAASGAVSVQQNYSLVYGSGSTIKQPTARMFVSPLVPDLAAISTTAGLYATNISSNPLQFTNITPQVQSSLPGTPKYPPGFAFGPDGTMYAAAGPEIFYGNPSITDYDPTAWKELYYAGSYVYNIKLSPNFATDKTMLIQTQDGVYISANGGSSFTKADLPLADGYYDIAFSSQDGTIAVVVPSKGVYLSADKGKTWKNIYAHRGATSVAIGNTGMYVGTDYSSGSQKGIYASWDKGNAWQNIGLENNKIAGLYLYQGSPDELYAVTDSGLEWTSVNAPQPAGQQVAAGQGNMQGSQQNNQSVSNTDQGNQPPAPAASSQDIKFVIGQKSYTVNGQVYSMDAAPFTDQGRTYVPVRYLAESLGVPDNAITWDSDTNTATLTMNGVTVKLVIGSTTYYVNGQANTMDVAPVEKDGRICLPARYVAEAFGYHVGWDAGIQTVSVTK
ncbi:copper amine oxidase N-terminal domain-containing protein [Desulfotomaculum copahuensis]|uniref:Copper amine oxidase-like N-terminal domain-containing protein n=1 Tax=Desulfotomaculum copahuensis TaxID=1838280 RepID=A0A1B7LG15_9FIRM|nr:copper amine oxidase N-terminal domain-containing protein [Desulfotomaculum copahuensis]OAT83675.1 hypothetical protein A6M21_07510 [Desulfotomaculum copahuensis]